MVAAAAGVEAVGMLVVIADSTVDGAEDVSISPFVGLISSMFVMACATLLDTINIVGKSRSSNNISRNLV